MKQLLEFLKTTLETMTSGETFPTRNGGLAELAVFTPELPPPESDDSTDEPCCEIVPLGWDDRPRPGCRIKIFFLLYSEDRLGALDDLDRLQIIIRPLSTKIFPGLRLQTMESSWGDEGTGIQYHPEYRLTVSLRYSGQPLRTNCNEE